MYCKFCGKEIDDDSKFCKHCGKQLEENKITKVDDNTIDTESISGWSIFVKFLIITFISFLIVFVIIKVGSNSGSDGNVINNIVERDITSNDYYVKTSQGITSFSVVIIPNRKIKTCSVECNIFNSSGDVIYSDTITKSNLSMDSSYTYTFDYGFLNALSGYSASYRVTGKC